MNPYSVNYFTSIFIVSGIAEVTELYPRKECMREDKKHAIVLVRKIR